LAIASGRTRRLAAEGERAPPVLLGAVVCPGLGAVVVARQRGSR
jgi:hypothetical protein